MIRLTANVTPPEPLFKPELKLEIKSEPNLEKLDFADEVSDEESCILLTTPDMSTLEAADDIELSDCVIAAVPLVTPVVSMLDIPLNDATSESIDEVSVEIVELSSNVLPLMLDDNDLRLPIIDDRAVAACDTPVVSIPEKDEINEAKPDPD